MTIASFRTHSEHSIDRHRLVARCGCQRNEGGGGGAGGGGGMGIITM